MLTIYSTVKKKLDNLLLSIDPLTIDQKNPKEMIVSTINYNRDLTILYFLKQRANDLEQENIDLSFNINSNKQLEETYINLLKAESQLRLLKQNLTIIQSSPHILQQGKPDHVKLSKLKAHVRKMTNENASLQLQIDSIERRIDLMQRKRSYIPFATVSTPRRNRP